MIRFYIILSALFLNHEVLSMPNLNWPFIESILESPQYHDTRRYYPEIETSQFHQELPRYKTQQMIDTYMPSVRLATDLSPKNHPNSINPNPVNYKPCVCSPAVRKNLANTIQIMMMTDLLENQEEGNEMVLRMAAPVLNDILSGSFRSPNPIQSNFVKSSAPISPSFAFTQSVGTPVSSRMAPPNFPDNEMVLRMAAPISNDLLSGSFRSPLNSIGSNFVKSSAPISSFSLTPTHSVVGTPVSSMVSSNMSPNILSSVSPNGRIERGFLLRLLKALGGGI